MIWSDNGTNFIWAEKELREGIEKWNVVNNAAELAHKGIKWRFNPPSGPHQGGIWERLVRSFKRVLYTILGTHRLTDEVLHTTLCLVENALNFRYVDQFTRPSTCKTCTSFPNIFFRAGGCYVVNERILANQNRVFPNFKVRIKYVLIYVESSEKFHLT